MTEITDVLDKELVVPKVGRPDAITEDVVSKLEAALQRGVSVSTACTYAGIARITYYRKISADPEFSNRMDKAKSFTSMVAAENVVAAITQDKDLATSKWWLERKEPEEFASKGNQVNVQNNTQVNNNVYVKSSRTEISREFDALFGGAAGVSQEESAQGNPA